MRQIILLFICFCLLKDVAAQVKQKTTKTNEKGKIVRDEPEPPPPMEELKELSIDTGSIIQEPAIDFDTSAVPEDDLTAAIRQYFGETGTLRNSIGVLKMLYEDEDMKKLIPDSFRLKLIGAFEPGGLGYKYIELMYLKSYRKHYTKEDIEGLLIFQKTPLGQKTIKVSAAMMIENSVEGQKIGKWVARKLM